MTLSEKIVAPIARIRYETLPKDVVEKAKLCILHALSCSFAGVDAKWSKAAREMTALLHPDGPASVWFRKQRSNMADAAFANGTAAQSILQEDIHRDSNSHPGIIIIPAALAVGEALRADGRRLLAAVVAGYETMGRVGRGTVCPEFGRRGFRPTSIIGTFGSAIAAGHLLDNDLPTHLAAFALAANFTSGINEWAFTGTDDLYFQNGMASRNGVAAAQLAKLGVSAPLTILEGKAGVCAAYDFSLANLQAVNAEDGHYVIADVLYKPAPSCALVQTTVQAALDAAGQGVKADDVAKGTIHTFALGKNYAGCDGVGPFTELLQARMSNQFNFATTLINGKVSNRNYHDFANPAVGALAGKLRIEEDAAFTRAFPEKQSVRVELTMKDGRTRTFAREEPVYLGREDVIAKFHEHFEPVYGKTTTEQAAELVLTLEKADAINGLCDLLAR